VFCCKTVPASNLPPDYYKLHCQEVPLSKIIGDVVECHDLKVKTVAFQLSKREEEFLRNVTSPGPSPDDVSLQVHKIIYSAKQLHNVPELVHSTGITSFLEDFLDGNFFHLCLLVKEYNICKFSTSQPELYKKKYVVDSCIIRSASFLQEMNTDAGMMIQDTEVTDSAKPPQTLLGNAAEDKVAEGGESQAIAAMILLAAHLGVKAVNEKKHFERAIIFGYSTNIEKTSVRPYKLHLDFVNRRSTIYKSVDSVDVGTYISSVKQMLENPHHINT